MYEGRYAFLLSMAFFLNKKYDLPAVRTINFANDKMNKKTLCPSFERTRHISQMTFTCLFNSLVLF